MKKKGIILISVIMSVFVLGGCGQKISNEAISIKQYKNLEVTKPADEDDYAAVLSFEDDIWEALIAKCTLKEYPQEELQQLIEELRLGYSYVVTEHADSEKLIEEIHGMTVEELAEQELKKRYAIQLIAEEEGLELTEDEYQQELEERALANGMSSEEYESLLGRDEQYRMFLEERVLECLKEHLK